MKKNKTNYWLFQSNPKSLLLKEALEAETLHTFLVKAHKAKIRQGDKVILWQSGKPTGCYGLATILSDPAQITITAIEKPYYSTIPKKGLRVSLEIDYNLWNKPITKEILPYGPGFEPFYAGMAGTNFKATKAQYKALLEVIERVDTVEEPATKYLPIQKSLQYLNLILQGPPGTGKTYQTVNHALSIIEQRSLKELAIEPRAVLRKRFETYQAAGQVQFITFHQSYSYEDFVEGIKPSTKQGQIVYGIEDGIFKKICLAAQQAIIETLQKQKDMAEDKQTSNDIKTLSPLYISDDLLKQCPKYVLIIDEINRGNLSSIFGELITLLEADKRIGRPEAMTTTLPYSKEKFTVPPNLHLLGTMNTSDRSTTPIDHALRRRFDFKEMPPLPDLLNHPMEAGVNLPTLLRVMNHKIERLLDEDHLIGHAYFMSVQTLEDLSLLFDRKIIPLLKAYFFNDLQKVAWIIGQQFFEEKASIDRSLLDHLNAPFLDGRQEGKQLQLKARTTWREKDFIQIYIGKE